MTLKASGLTLSNHARNSWFVVVDPGTTVEQVMQDEFWVHVQLRLHRFDRIEVVSADKSLYADILVLSEQGKALALKLIHKVVDEASAEAIDVEDGKYRIEFISTGWRVLKRQGRGYTEVSGGGGHASSDIAIKWLHDYKQAVAA